MTRGFLYAAGILLTMSCGEPSPDIDAGTDEVLSDPLSMPAEPTLERGSFVSAAKCGVCHTQHFAEWKTSMHSYAMVDPVYRALVQERQAEYNGAQDKFCLQCHSAIATRSGEIQPNFVFDELSSISLEGITCESCHKVASVERDFNSGHVFDADGPIRGSISNPQQTPAHESSYSPLHETSEFCGACHDIVEVSGLNLERPYAEWLESPAAGAQENCQSCHMPTYEGSAAVDGPVRTLHRHRWIGVDVPLKDGYLTGEEEAVVRAGVRELLEGAASVDLEASPAGTDGIVDLYVTASNNISAHNFPTGSTFLRQAWIEVTVRDANGSILYQTGDVDENGDLRNFFSEADPFGDPDLLLLSSSFINSDGFPEIFSWKATEHISGSLSPLYQRTFTLFIPTSQATLGPLQADARIRFRPFAPYLLRTLGLDEYIEKVEITDVAAATLSIPVVND